MLPAEDNEVTIDSDSKKALEQVVEKGGAAGHRIAGVHTVLVVLSSSGMVYDMNSLQQKILASYPDSTVFFLCTNGKSLTAAAPERVDLLIDLTGPGQRQPFLFSRKLRRMARVAVGRNAGWFRKRTYDFVVEDGSSAGTAPDIREREIQKKIFSLSGVVLAHSGDTPPDRGNITPRELPPLRRSPSLL